MHNPSTCPICRGGPTGGSLSDDAFREFVAACRDELAVKQPAFQQRITGASEWRYDLADGSLTVGAARFGMTPLGTLSPQHRTWLWGWANDAFPEAARATARRLQELHVTTGFRVFLDPGVRAMAADALDLAAVAVHHLAAVGVFRCPSDGPVLYLAVHEPVPAGNC